MPVRETPPMFAFVAIHFSCHRDNVDALPRQARDEPGRQQETNPIQTNKLACVCVCVSAGRAPSATRRESARQSAAATSALSNRHTTRGSGCDPQPCGFRQRCVSQVNIFISSSVLWLNRCSSDESNLSTTVPVDQTCTASRRASESESVLNCNFFAVTQPASPPQQ